MITKISKLKNFSIFHDFTWKKELPEFKKFNLIYGWNRSGKTTISRVFASCEKKRTFDKDKFKQYPENGEFEIKTSDNANIKSTDVAANTLPIKVFNKDFIDDNISFDPSNSCNPITYVSEEDIKSKNRNMIRKAIKNDLTVDQSDDFETFKKILVFVKNKKQANILHEELDLLIPRIADVIHSKALEFIEDNKKNPFFMYLSS
jgi:wobble nucleotide-excising tRNase